MFYMYMTWADAHPALFYLIVVFVFLPLLAGTLTTIVERFTNDD